VDSDQEASRAFQQALLQAQKNTDSKQVPTDTEDGGSDRQVTLTENDSSNATSSSKSNSSLNTERGVGSTSMGLFLAGLLLPFLTAIIITSLFFQEGRTSINHGSVYTPEDKPSISLNNVTYEVYEVTMTNGFSDDYPPDCHQNCWDFTVEIHTSQGDVDKAIYGYSVGPSLNSFDPVLENGSKWYLMDLRNCQGYVPEFDCNDEIYIKINTDGTVNIATNYGRPTFIEYASISSWEYETEPLLRNLGCGVLPISMIAGIIWGFKTDKKPFAYGIITAGVIPFVGFILMIFMLGGITN
jgi:hypothetical protein